MKRTLSLAALFVLTAALSGCGVRVSDVPRTVAKVNGDPIDAAVYLDQVHRRFGEDVLRNLIEQRIIIQWAQDEKVPPTRRQIQEQIERLKRDGNYEDQVRIMGEDNLWSEIEAVQARINLALKFTKITEQELKDAYEAMKPRFVHGKRRQVLVVLNTDAAKLERALKELKDGRDFREVAAKYADRRFSMGEPIRVWVDLDEPGAMPPAIVKAAKETKVGEVSDVLSFGGQTGSAQYAILKVVREQAKMNKPFRDVKDEIKSYVALQKSQTDPAFLRKFNKRLRDAKIEINIKQFRNLVYAIKNPVEPPSMISPGGRGQGTGQ
ncbi:MAG: peptidyl-prolyl cis-trans isomerase [Armatimonadota bacterium]|nr:peptidyl-prolyl cis-trans isomerase [Armatimonadota bacterium]